MNKNKKLSMRLGNVLVLVSLLVAGSFVAGPKTYAATADEIHWVPTSQTSVTVSWRGQDTALNYGTTQGSYTSSVTAQDPPTIPQDNAGPFRRAKITGLAENTTYYYQVGDKTGAFRTPPPKGSSDFTIFAEGDMQGGSGGASAQSFVQNYIAAANPAMVLFMGDNTSADEQNITYINQRNNEWMNSFAKNVPIFPAWGNHEMDHSPDLMQNHKGRFDMPNQQKSPGASAYSGNIGYDWGWLDYGNVRLISVPYPNSGDEADWNTKAKTLMDQAQADPNISYIITFGHYPVYTTGSHGSDSRLTSAMNALGDTHTKYVMNIQGHNHIYERSYPQHGVVHYTDASPTYSYAYGSATPQMATRISHTGFLKIRVTSTGIQTSFVCGRTGSGTATDTCAEGQEYDSYSIGNPGGGGGTNDTEAPAVPSSLTATAMSSSQINLSWSASTDNVGVAGYIIYRNGTQVASTTNTSYSDTGLTPSTAYTYKVAAYDAAGNQSAQSSQASATTQTPPTVADDEIHWSIISQTAITVDWRGSDNTVRYGPSAGNYTNTINAATPNPVPFSSNGPFWEAKITGLSENTIYYYQIGTNGPTGTFKTPISKGSSGFTIFAESDMQNDNSVKMDTVQNIISAANPSFVLFNGDNTGADSIGQYYADVKFNEYMAWSKKAAIMPAWGNHEWDNSGDNLNNYKGRYDLPNPQRSPGTPAISDISPYEDWGWFDYGNVRFISYPEPWTSSSWSDWNTKAKTLMDQAQADSNIKFIVTYGHRLAYGSGYYSGSSTLKGYMDALGDAHSKYVLNINGHSHIYERSNPSVTHGVTHITDGTPDSLDHPASSGPGAFTAARYLHLGTLKLTFSADKIEGSYVCGSSDSAEDVTCSSGTAIDTFTIGGTSCTDTTWTPDPSTICSETNFTQASNCGNTRTIAGTKNCTCADTTWTPDPATVCSGTLFTQTSNCSNTRTSTGTKACTCTDTSWTPDPATVCSGTTFTQTSNCSNTRTSTGTKTCGGSSFGPQTSFHYTNNDGSSGGSYPPGAVGFNVADVSSNSQLNALPSGVMGMVWIGYSGGGADSTFRSMVDPFKGNSRVFGFYLADEPDITGSWGTYYSPDNLKAQADYIHANFPNAKVFILIVNQGADNSPTYLAKDKNTGLVSAYTYENTHADLFGLDPYPIQNQFASQLASNSEQFLNNYMASYVDAAIASGVTRETIVPVYQAFGNYAGGDWVLPTPTQETQIIKAWGYVVPTPYFDYAYAWGQQAGDTPLSAAPELQPIFLQHNTGGGTCTDSSWTPDTSTICSGTSFTQTSNCSNTRTSTGTKTCTCTDTSWTPDPATVCSGTSFTQTSNCSNTRTSSGTRSCSSGSLITNPASVFSVPAFSWPGYLSSIFDPTFGTKITRITGNAGDTINFSAGGTGSWGADARHHYSKDEPWNSDQSLIAVENNGSPSQVYLDGETYQPKYAKCSNYSVGEDRWHPSPSHPNERINMKDNYIQWFDVTQCKETKHITLPWNVDGFGSSEGNASFDGKYVAVTDSNDQYLAVVDMDSGQIGPSYDITDCGLQSCAIDWVSVSASGKYAVVSYQWDIPRVFNVDSSTLALTPMSMPSSSLMCTGSAASPNADTSLQNRSKGYVYNLGHSDMTINPFDNNEDVLVGQRRSWCSNVAADDSGKSIGQIVMVRLKDGKVTTLTSSSNSVQVHHISTRNQDRLGWAYAGFYQGSGKRYNDEVMAVKLDGSETVERLAHKHSVFSGCYRCESHAVPSRDGKRVIFASNWAENCGSVCGASSEIKDYVVDIRSMGGGTDTAPPSVPIGLTVK